MSRHDTPETCQIVPTSQRCEPAEPSDTTSLGLRPASFRRSKASAAPIAASIGPTPTMTG
jgi:hypothetical protein